MKKIFSLLFLFCGFALTTVGQAHEDEVLAIGGKRVFRTYRIFFDYDKATIRPTSDSAVAAFAQLLKDNPTWVMEIGAHVDQRGSAQYSRRLDQARATSVLERLIQEGIAPARLVAKGYGESSPVIEHDVILAMKSKEDQEIAYARNRRIEFKILSTNYTESKAEAVGSLSDAEKEIEPAEPTKQEPAERPFKEVVYTDVARLDPPLPGCSDHQVKIDGVTYDLYRTRRVVFSYNKTEITPSSKALLDSIALVLIDHPDMKIEVAGFTDSRGSSKYNQKLSEMRAKSVVNYLVYKGVTESNLSSRGLGEFYPLVSNEEIAKMTVPAKKENAHKKNRRLELRVLK